MIYRIWRMRIRNCDPRLKASTDPLCGYFAPIHSCPTNRKKIKEKVKPKWSQRILYYWPLPSPLGALVAILPGADGNTGSLCKNLGRRRFLEYAFIWRFFDVSIEPQSESNFPFLYIIVMWNTERDLNTINCILRLLVIFIAPPRNSKVTTYM